MKGNSGIAKAGEKYEQAIDRVANQKAKGPAPILDYYGNVAPPTNAPPIVAGNPKKPKTQSYGQGGVSAGAGFNGVVPQTNLGSGVKTSTGTSAVNPINSGAGNSAAAKSNIGPFRMARSQKRGSGKRADSYRMATNRRLQKQNEAERIEQQVMQIHLANGGILEDFWRT